MNAPKTTRPSWLRFAAAVLAGLGLTVAVVMGLAMGECLPRDASATMHACDAAKQREFWLFPLLLLVTLVLAVWLQMRGSRWGQGLALAGAMIAAMAMMGIEWLIG